MTDPIGTAQERELIERLRSDADYQDSDDEPVVSTNCMRNAADALSSRIAEVGRLRSLVENAYSEGYSQGMTAGGLVNEEDDWLKSEARAALSLQTLDAIR